MTQQTLNGRQLVFGRDPDGNPISVAVDEFGNLLVQGAGIAPAATEIKVVDGTNVAIKLKVNADGSIDVGGTVALDEDTITALTEGGGLTDAQLRASPVPVSGTVTATGPLTDAQLRATPVPVNTGLTTQTDALTDTQLRATPVPVDTGLAQAVTNTQLRAAPVVVDTGLAPLTDAQLRATPVPVSGTVTATPTGTQTVAGTVALDSTTLAALESIQAAVAGTVALDSTTLAALENIIVTGTVALDATTLAALETISAVVSGTVAVSNFPGTQAVSDGGGSLTVDGTVALDASTLAALESITATVSGSVAVTGPLTDAQLRASAVPVSGTVTTTPSGIQDIDGSVAHGATDTGDPVKVGGRYSASTPTPVTDGQRVNAWYDKHGRPNTALHSPELGSSVAQTSLRDLQVAQRYTVLSDSIADGLAPFWTLTQTGAGTAPAVSNGEGTLSPGAAINSSSQMVSPAVRYYPGQSAWLNSAVRFSDTGVAGNVRRIGAFTVIGTTPQDGFYFELSGTTLNAVVIKGGVVQSSVDSTAWTRVGADPFVLDTNYHSFEIRWTANGAQFYVDNVLRHSYAGTTTGITATLNFPITLQSVNTSSTTNATISVRNIGLGRFGTPPAEPRFGTYGGQAGTAGTVNVPAGAVVRSYAAQSGVSAASVTVPGVTGTITVPGSNQAQTQFADQLDHGVMVGPCTFIFTNTASYVVIWVV